MTVLALPAPETAPSVRTLARQQNIDIGLLIRILSLRRPDQSLTETEFVEEFLDPIPGIQMDVFGNRYLTIGENPTVLWSCHTDTVSKEGGNQNLKWIGDTLALNQGKPGMSLGADDGAGLWLLLEMIKADKPGLYIFHRAEECGGLGSSHIKAKTPELLDGIKMAIAFDRKGTNSVITHQRGGRCCSKEFAEAFSAMLGGTYSPDSTGTFTDTANYIKLVPECTNVSVGYYKEHGPQETLDVAHLLKLRETMLAIDVTTLPVERDPSKVEYDDYDGWGSYGGWSYGHKSVERKPETPYQKIVDMVQEKPFTVARWIENMGLTPFLFGAILDRVWTGSKEWKGALADPPANDQDLAEIEEELEPALYCADCEEVTTDLYTRFGAYDGAACDMCGSNNTQGVHLDETGEVAW